MGLFKKTQTCVSHLGKPFDLMSRRMVSANNHKIAERIWPEIEIFDVTRDDAEPEQNQLKQK